MCRVQEVLLEEDMRESSKAFKNRISRFTFIPVDAIKFALPFRSKVGTTLSQMDKYDIVFVGYVQCGLCIVSEKLISVQFGKGTHWFGANTWLIHPTAVQSAAAFPHYPVEDEILGRNVVGQRSDGSYDLVSCPNEFVTIASMHCKLLM
ncbi:hypothetical protein Bca4012_064242 [Brassica carinata]